MRFTPRRSSPRMPSFEYVGPYTYHLVLSTRRRVPRFQNARLVAECVGCLNASARNYAYDILAYCFMPDHLHLLVTGSDDAPLSRFVQHFKQSTGHKHPGLWQRSFYDHILRSEEAVEQTAVYIWGNPVRAGIVNEAADYPFSGPREVLELQGLPDSYAEDRAKALSLQIVELQGLPNSYAEDRAKALSLQSPSRLVSAKSKEVPAWKP